MFLSALAKVTIKQSVFNEFGKSVYERKFCQSLYILLRVKNLRYSIFKFFRSNTSFVFDLSQLAIRCFHCVNFSVYI